MNLLSWSSYSVLGSLPPLDGEDGAFPLVSIVTPSYNQGQYIRETIESVLTQDYPNIEYWVIDGGSTDSTLDILRSYNHDPRFDWISESDKGQSDAINKGWSRCHGEILAWLGSDDLYYPGAITSQVNYLLSHPDVDAVYSDAVYISSDGQPTRVYWSRNFSQHELLRICYIPQPTTFLRRSLVEGTGPLDVSLHHALDYDYWLRACLRGTFAYSPGKIAKYRLHADSKTVAQSTKFNPEIERIVTRFFKQENVPQEIRQKRKTLLADLMLEIAINFARSHHLTDSARYFCRSLQYSLLRPRDFWLILNWLQALTRLPIADILSETWTQQRSKF
jgi:glycosyltransferase involved in cell wall biosynthesis